MIVITKPRKMMFIAFLILCLVFSLFSTVLASSPPQPQVLPLDVQVTPGTQDVTIVDGYNGEWTEYVSGGATPYTVSYDSGDGSKGTLTYQTESTYIWGHKFGGAFTTYTQNWRVVSNDGQTRSVTTKATKK